MGSRRGGSRSQGSVGYLKIELLEARCVLSGSPWAAATHFSSLRSDSAIDFGNHLAESYYFAKSFGDQGQGNDFASGSSQFSITNSNGSWRNNFDLDGSQNDGFAGFNHLSDGWQEGLDGQSNWQSTGGSLSLSSSGSGSLNLQSTGDQGSNSDQSSSSGVGLGIGGSSSGGLSLGTTQDCAPTSDSASTGSPTLSLGSTSTITISSPTIPGQPPTEIDVGSSNSALGTGLVLGPPPGGIDLSGPTLSIPGGVEVTIAPSVVPPTVNAAVGVNVAIDGGHSHSIDPNVTAAVQPALNLNLAAAVSLAQPTTANVATQSSPAIDVVAATSGHGSAQPGALSHLSPTVATTTATATASIPMIAVSGSIEGGSVAQAAVPSQSAGAAPSLAGSANHLAAVHGSAKSVGGAKGDGDSDHTPVIAGMPVSLAAVNHAIDTVMSQISSLGTGFSRWFDDLHVSPTTLEFGVGALAVATTVYARRRFKRKLEEIEDEASSSWLFARMQAASAE